MPRNTEVEHYASLDGGEIISAIMVKDGVALDLTGYTVTFAMYETDAGNGVEVVAESSTGIVQQPTQTATYNSTVNKFRCYSHGLEDKDEVVFSSTAAGVTSGVRYFVRDVTPHYFNVCLEPGEAAITLSSGSSDFYIVGHVQYTPQSGDYGTVGTYYAAFFTDDPHERYPEVRHQNAGGMIKVYVK